ncbi:MAG: hypothetical protein KF784_01755 [Fimbriimonadaceae bacterium]|nr:hypothetical protein [Fimbriimonadaceae bacterium]
MSLKLKSIFAVVAVAASIALVGCGADSGTPAADNDQIRKENPTDQRPSLGDGPAETPAKE